MNNPPDGMPVDVPQDPPPPYNQGPTSHGWVSHMSHPRDRTMHPGPDMIVGPRMVRAPSRLPMEGHHRMPGHLRFQPGSRMASRMPMYPGSGPQPGYMGPVMTRGSVPRMPQPNEPFPFSKKLTEKASMYVNREGHMASSSGMAPGMFVDGEPGMVPRMNSPEWANTYGNPSSISHVRLSHGAENISPPHGPPMGMPAPGSMHGQPRMDAPVSPMEHNMRMPNPNMHNPSYGGMHSKIPGQGPGGPMANYPPDGGPDMPNMAGSMDGRAMSGNMTPQDANNAIMLENLRRDANRPPDMKMNTVMPKSPMPNYQGGE